MSDDRVLDFLRDRGRASVPVDLRYTISAAVADAPQHRSLRFAAFAPALLGVGGVAAALLLALIIGQSRDVGPSPVPSASASAAAPKPVGQRHPGDLACEPR